MNKKLCLSILIFLGVYKNIGCSQDFRQGAELGSVAISVLASILQTHNTYTTNASFHEALGKNYSIKKIVDDTYIPLMFATIQLATLASSRSSIENSSPVVNCIFAALSIWYMNYENSLKTSSHHTLLIKSMENSKRSRKALQDCDRVMALQQTVIENSSAQLQQARQSSVAILTQALQHPIAATVVEHRDENRQLRAMITSSSQETLQS